MFSEVEGIIRRQVNVSILTCSYLISYVQWCGVVLNVLRLLFNCAYCHNFAFQMSVLPSVQPFHAIAYPIDPILALEIR